MGLQKYTVFLLVNLGFWAEIKGFEIPKNGGIMVGFSRVSQKPTRSRSLVLLTKVEAFAFLEEESRCSKAKHEREWVDGSAFRIHSIWA